MTWGGRNEQGSVASAQGTPFETRWRIIRSRQVLWAFRPPIIPDKTYAPSTRYEILVGLAPKGQKRPPDEELPIDQETRTAVVSTAESCSASDDAASLE